MAQPILGHSERVATIRSLCAETPGLHLIGNGFEGVGIPDLALQAEHLAEQFAS